MSFLRLIGIERDERLQCDYIAPRLLGSTLQGSAMSLVLAIKHFLQRRFLARLFCLTFGADIDYNDTCF